MVSYIRQTGIFNPDNQRLNIHIIGCGSTGSFIALNLAKLGFNNIACYDFDLVEEHNIPNQFYRLSDINKLKVDALYEIIKDFTGTEINPVPKKITEEYSLIDFVDLNSLVILCTDNMESRKLIYEQIKDLPIGLIDTRLGGEGYQIYYIDLTNEEQKKTYEECLNAETVEAPCGQKAVIYTILSIASETCRIIKNIDQNKPVPTILKREMNNYKFLNNLEENGN